MASQNAYLTVVDFRFLREWSNFEIDQLSGLLFDLFSLQRAQLFTIFAALRLSFIDATENQGGAGIIAENCSYPTIIFIKFELFYCFTAIKMLDEMSVVIQIFCMIGLRKGNPRCGCRQVL